MEQSVRDWYSEDEVEVWLVNPDDSLDNAFSFVGDAGVQLPVLLDLGGTNYFAYPRDVELPFGPFPVQVVIGPDGVIRYLAFQNDPTSLRAVIDELLAGG